GETQVIDNREGVAQDQRIVYQFEVRDEAKFYANLVWTDAPASANAAVALVNDLDLQLTFPDGRVLSSEDHVNNQESLEIDSLKPGIYQLAVRGFRVPAAPEGHQSFAFIYSVFEKKRGP
ncbi:MAG TPA: PPC domain-containing protein, partial [Bdellovibrio sp.]|nr:PPC domain-containing protein [Bdellovibrio sp.]